MRTKDGRTPRQVAHDIAITAVRNACVAIDERVDEKLTDRQRKAIYEQLIKIHNRLLEKSGLDGIPLT